jgi:hypothetical protein
MMFRMITSFYVAQWGLYDPHCRAYPSLPVLSPEEAKRAKAL